MIGIGRTRPAVAVAAVVIGACFVAIEAAASQVTTPLSIVRLKPSTAAHGLVRDRVNVIPATSRLSFRVVLRNRGRSAAAARVTLRIGTRNYSQTANRSIHVPAGTTRSTAFRRLEQVAFAQRQTIVVRVRDQSGRTRSASYPVIFTLP